jgi:hypothetical protein
MPIEGLDSPVMNFREELWRRISSCMHKMLAEVLSLECLLSAGTGPFSNIGVIVPCARIVTFEQFPLLFHYLLKGSLRPRMAGAIIMSEPASFVDVLLDSLSNYNECRLIELRMQKEVEIRMFL